jgi:signal peptidase II
MSETFQNLNQTERPVKKSFGFWLLVLILLIGVTQFVRIIIVQNQFAYFANDKFAFSLNVPVVVMYAIYLLVMTAIIIFLKKEWFIIADTKKTGFVLIVAGGLANMFERVFMGHVIDYIFLLSGVLNLADLYIILGALLIVIDKNIFKNL